MGVTIHFQGKLKSEADFLKLMAETEIFAIKNEMPFNYFEETNKLLLRVKDGKEWDYKGFTKGMIIQPDQNVDPFNLEFDENLFIEEYCKTQYADISVHIKLIRFLKLIKPYFLELKINDEGGYLETDDSIILQNHFNKVFEMAEEAKKENPGLTGPFKMADGRIIDLMKG
jgi:hypothetical protein